MRGLLVVTVLAWAATAARADIVETRKGAEVYTAPDGRHSRGHVVRGARFEVLERASGKRCKGEWLRIYDRTWLCSRNARPTDEAATAADGRRKALPYTFVATQDATAYPTLDDAVARTNGVDLPGQGGFKYRGERTRKGELFVKVHAGWIPAADAQVVRSIDFSGHALAAEARGKRLAFVGPRRARVYQKDGSRGHGFVAPHSWLGEVGAPMRVGRRTLVPLADGRFIDRRYVSIATWPEPPEVNTGEHWIDIDLSQQLMIAYEGQRPVWATLVLTANTATPVGEFRIEKKRPMARMTNRPGYQHKWDVLAPWVVTIQGRIAFHTAYWHQQYGRTRSQGCVNLSPQDARYIWNFTEPAMPPGFSRLQTTAEDHPTLVRIRRSK